MPNRLLQRHQVHGGQIVDLSSGYPSRPFAVASRSMSGPQTLVDLSRPTTDFTEQGVSAYTIQQPGVDGSGSGSGGGGLMAWSDHLLGFVDVWPSGKMVGSGGRGATLGFSHVEHFARMRHVVDLSAGPTCVTIGTTHPFLLVGAADGSLVCLNPLSRLFRPKNERVAARKIRVFQHDYSPAPAAKKSKGSAGDELSSGSKPSPPPPSPQRGAARIVHGFAPEVNEHNKSETMRRVMAGLRGRKSGKLKGPKARERLARRLGKRSGATAASAAMDDDGGGNATGHSTTKVELAIFEPLTRITAVAWNPNAEYGCWAAAATASGLLKVMDLGDETPPERGSTAGP